MAGSLPNKLGNDNIPAAGGNFRLCKALVKLVPSPNSTPTIERAMAAKKSGDNEGHDPLRRLHHEEDEDGAPYQGSDTGDPAQDAPVLLAFRAIERMLKSVQGDVRRLSDEMKDLPTIKNDVEAIRRDASREASRLDDMMRRLSALEIWQAEHRGSAKVGDKQSDRGSTLLISIIAGIVVAVSAMFISGNTNKPDGGTAEAIKSLVQVLKEKK